MTGTALKQKLSPWGKTAAEWADLLGVSDKTIYRLFKANDVRTETVERLCMSLNMPITSLYGEDESGDRGKGATKGGIVRIKSMDTRGEPRQEPYIFERAFNLNKKVRDLLAERRSKMSDLARHMEVNYSTVTRMCANNSCSLASLMRIADFFKVPVTYFLPKDRLAMEEAEKDRQINFLKGQIEVYRRTLSTLLNNDVP